jgi:predicted transcriptional regulator of viral defense system
MPEASYLTDAERPLSAHPARELAIAELFARQKTVATVAQLRELGLSQRAASRRAQTGRLYRIYPAVYSTTPPELLPRTARWLAAVFACGPEALLSHRTAAALHGVRPTTSSRIDVTSPTARGRRLTGIDAHLGRNLAPADITAADGIPCTSLARTFVDFAPLVERRAVERAIDQAEITEIFDLTAFNDVLARNATLPGAALVRAVLNDYQQVEAHLSTLTENDFEEAFLALCDAAAFPRPEVQPYLTLPSGDVFRPDFL